MLSKPILDIANELTRLAQSAKPTHDQLHQQLAKLQRATALQSSEPRAAIIALRNHLAPHFPNASLYDGITARVLELLDAHDDPSARSKLHAALDRLVEDVMAAPAELADQLCAMLRGGDRLVVLAEAAAAQPIEVAIIDAAASLASALNNKSNNTSASKSKAAVSSSSSSLSSASTAAPSEQQQQIHVSVLYDAVEEDSAAAAMATRLAARGVPAAAIHAGQLVGALAAATKVVLPVLAGDPDNGLLCPGGAAATAGLATRCGVPVLAAGARHALQPAGHSGMSALAAADAAAPGAVWAYEAARDDRKRDAVVIVAPRFDLVPLQKIDTIVSDVGPFAPGYLVNVVPNLEKREPEQQHQPC